MAEMDIYMRRRLVALGGLVLFFIFFVLLVKSCGGDEEQAPLQDVNTGATGEGGAVALSTEDFIIEADRICAEANSSVGALDPEDPNATRDEFSITSSELEQLEALPLADPPRPITRFLGALGDVVAALREKSRAERQGDDLAAGEAQIAIDTAEVEARELGERAGFSECGQFLDAGEAPGGAGTDSGTETTPTDPGTVAPETGGVTPAPAPDTAPAPAPDTAPDTGGGTGSGDAGGGISP